MSIFGSLVHVCACLCEHVCMGVYVCVWWPELQAGCTVSQGFWWEPSVNKAVAPQLHLNLKNLLPNSNSSLSLFHTRVHTLLCSWYHSSPTKDSPFTAIYHPFRHQAHIVDARKNQLIVSKSEKRHSVYQLTAINKVWEQNDIWLEKWIMTVNHQCQ